MIRWRYKFGVLIFLIITLCSAIWAAPKAKETKPFRFHPITRDQYKAIMGITGGKPVVSEARLIASGVAALKGLAAGVATAFAATGIWGVLSGGGTNVTRRENYADGYPLCMIETDEPQETPQMPEIPGDTPVDNGGGEGERQAVEIPAEANWNRRGVNGHLNCVVVVRRDEFENAQRPTEEAQGSFPSPWQYPWPQYPQYPYPYPYPPFMPPNPNERKSVGPPPTSYSPYPAYWYYAPQPEYSAYNYNPYFAGYRGYNVQEEDANQTEDDDDDNSVEEAPTEAPKQTSTARRRFNKHKSKKRHHHQRRRQHFLHEGQRNPRISSDGVEGRMYSQIHRVNTQSYSQLGYEPTTYPQVSYHSTYPKVSYSQPTAYSAPVYIESTQHESEKKNNDELA